MIFIQLNLLQFLEDGTLWGFNPFPAFIGETLWPTLVFYTLALIAVISSVSSYFFEREKGNHEDLPDEFYHYDSTRMHYVLVAGTRNDYIDKTYRVRRSEKKKSGVILLHYDNLIDYSEELFNRNTF